MEWLTGGRRLGRRKGEDFIDLNRVLRFGTLLWNEQSWC